LIQRQVEEEEEMLQPKESTGQTAKDTPNLGSRINSLKGGGEPLPEKTHSGFESKFGDNLSGVKIHNNENADSMNRSLNARAFTVGKDIFFRHGEYNPESTAGKKLLAHELTHVVQQRSGMKRIQRTPTMVPPTNQDRRDFVQATIDFLNSSADYYRDYRRNFDQALFERVINSWYRMVVDRERMIDNHLGGDILLKRELRAAYTAAIRVLMSKAAVAFSRSERDLYRENSGRIPIWAWQTPHHMESGISTPVAQGRSADPLTGEVGFAENGFQVTIAQDGQDNSLGNGAETRMNIRWGRIRYQSIPQGGQRIIDSFTGPGTPTARIQTFYGSGVNASSSSGYGRGTTPQDIAGGRVTPRSTSLGFHEGAHGLAYIEFFQQNPPPRFTGRTGMTEAQFQTAMNQYQADCRAYVDRANAYSERVTDCVGTTIDQFNQANAAPGATVTLVCSP
jgi:hypothetical protein